MRPLEAKLADTGDAGGAAVGTADEFTALLTPSDWGT